MNSSSASRPTSAVLVFALRVSCERVAYHRSQKHVISAGRLILHVYVGPSVIYRYVSLHPYCLVQRVHTEESFMNVCVFCRNQGKAEVSIDHIFLFSFKGIHSFSV